MGKITSYGAITAVDPADEFVVVEGGPGGTTKKATTNVPWKFGSSLESKNWLNTWYTGTTNWANYATNSHYILLAKESTDDKVFGRIFGYRGSAFDGPRGFTIDISIDASSVFGATADITNSNLTVNAISLTSITYNSETWWAIKVYPGTTIHSDNFGFTGFRDVTDTANFLKTLEDTLVTELTEKAYVQLTPNIQSNKDGTVSFINGGIHLGGTASANLLDDYEEGIWTPALWDSTLGTNSGTATATGEYTKIGNRVFIHGRITMYNLGSLITSNQSYIGGLPFAANNVNGSIVLSYAAGLNITAGYNIVMNSNLNEYYLTLRNWDINSGVSQTLISEISTTGDIVFSGQYTTNQ